MPFQLNCVHISHNAFFICVCVCVRVFVFFMKSLRIYNFDSQRLQIHFSLFKILHLHGILWWAQNIWCYQPPSLHTITKPHHTINISVVSCCLIRSSVLRHVIFCTRNTKNQSSLKNGKTFLISMFVCMCVRACVFFSSSRTNAYRYLLERDQEIMLFLNQPQNTRVKATMSPWCARG